VPRPSEWEEKFKMAASSSNSGSDYPIEDILSLLDAGFFDCEEEISEQINSMESDVSSNANLCSFFTRKPSLYTNNICFTFDCF